LYGRATKQPNNDLTDRSIGQLRYMVVSCVAMRERERERERERFESYDRKDFCKLC
jgi:hypothetical protein